MNDRGESVDRSAHPLFQAGGGGSTPTSPLSLHFYATDRETFRVWNREWHSRLPKIGASPGRVYYAAECERRIYAVAMWSNPVARLLPQLEWLELRRFAIANDAPKNTASRMLAWMIRDIRRRFPAVVRAISYQDLQAHTGTIYKAAGWKAAANYDHDGKWWSRGGIGWETRPGRTNQAMAPRMRWELALTGDAA